MNTYEATILTNSILSSFLNNKAVEEIQNGKITITVKLKDGKPQVSTIRTYIKEASDE